MSTDRKEENAALKRRKEAQADIGRSLQNLAKAVFELGLADAECALAFYYHGDDHYEPPPIANATYDLARAYWNGYNTLNHNQILPPDPKDWDQ